MLKVASKSGYASQSHLNHGDCMTWCVVFFFITKPGLECSTIRRAKGLDIYFCLKGYSSILQEVVDLSGGIQYIARCMSVRGDHDRTVSCLLQHLRWVGHLVG